MDEQPQRLQKLLSAAGFASRRNVEQLIEEQRILVNGTVAVLGDKATIHDDIVIDGHKVDLNVDKVTYLLNKPAGVLSTSNDELSRESVVDLIDTDERIYPVGRLDKDTTGLLLLTNDGDLTYRLTHPKHGVDKTYVAQLQGEVSQSDIELLRKGIMLDDGITAPAKVKILASKKDATLVEITIHEGRNRQIRRMAEAIGHSVITLHRTKIGPLADDTLEPGQYRQLSVKEIHELYSSSS